MASKTTKAEPIEPALPQGLQSDIVQDEPPDETVSDDTISFELAEPCYPTDRYVAGGVPYCQTCGEKLRTGLNGEPICPIADHECERNDA